MEATHKHQHDPYDTPPPDGTHVTSLARGPAVGVVKGLPFTIPGDNRRKVWVDYTASTGVTAIDNVRDLHAVGDV